MRNLLIVGVIVGLLFYWFGIRPGNIRKECSEKAVVQSIIVHPPALIPDKAKRTLAQANFETTYLQNCLNENGIAP